MQFANSLDSKLLSAGVIAVAIESRRKKTVEATNPQNYFLRGSVPKLGRSQ